MNRVSRTGPTKSGGGAAFECVNRCPEITDGPTEHASVTEMLKSHLGGPLEFRLRWTIRGLDG